MKSWPKQLRIHQIVVLCFDHKLGPTIEYIYPASCSLSDQIKNELLSLSIPDGSHKFESDFVYFTCANSKSKPIFCVACYHQQRLNVEQKDRHPSLTRNSIQKSIVLLMSLPLFEYVRQKLDILVSDFIKSDCMTDFTVIDRAFDHLQQTTIHSPIYRMHFDIGVSPSGIVHKFKYRLLTVFKLLLLSKKVVILSSPCELLGSTILSLVSLFPNALIAEQSYKLFIGPDKSKSQPKQRRSLPITESFLRHKMSVRSRSLEMKKEINKSTKRYVINHTSQSAYRISTNDCRFMERFLSNFHLFGKACLLYPYATMDIFDVLRNQSNMTEIRQGERCLAGVSNSLITDYDYVDCVISYDGTNIFKCRPHLKDLIRPSSADIKFMDLIIRSSLKHNETASVDDPLDVSVKQMFSIYLASLISTCIENDEKNFADFNREFVEAFMLTGTFMEFINCYDGFIKDSFCRHPCSLKNSAIRSRIDRIIEDLRRDRLADIGSNVGRVVDSALGNIRNRITSVRSKLKKM